MTLCPLNVSILENTVIFHKNVLFILTCDEFITVTLKWNNKYFLSLLSLLDWIQTVLPVESSRKVVFPLLSPDLCPCYSPCPKYPLFPPSSIASSRSESEVSLPPGSLPWCLWSSLCSHHSYAAPFQGSFQVCLGASPLPDCKLLLRLCTPHCWHTAWPLVGA